jgi:glycine cleavage system T protein (aminomethyltransferase)
MTMTTELLRTPLHDWHVSHGGRMVDFAGWSMPVQYTSIVEEHNATRNAVGVFDISHMGRIEFQATGSVCDFLDSVATRQITYRPKGKIRYSLICREDGGILDDVLIYSCLEDGYYPDAMVVNASNRLKILNWLSAHKSHHDDFSIVDCTVGTAMIAVQGPKTFEVVEPLITAFDGKSKVSDLRYYTYDAYEFGKGDVFVSRTGYTGEDGVEIICDAKNASELWEKIMVEASRVGGMAAGLGARDTLRLEAGMPLYGHELSEAINPLQAGLNFAVNLGGREFIGSKALEQIAQDKSQPVRIGLALDGKRVPRQGCPVLQGDEIVGEVTSGTFSITLNRPIAMAYVQPAAATIGSQLNIGIRGTQHPATIVPLPFYQRPKKN